MTMNELCVVEGCESHADVLVEAPSGWLRKVCHRCAEELVALFGFRRV